MKQVIFNVGGALSTYTEFDDKKLLVDIGKSEDFNPITDFLLPLFKKRNNAKNANNNSKYQIDQLIISHLHNDHISSIKDFNDNFYPDLLTCPNDNDGMEESHKINWKLIEENPNVDILKTMLDGRQPPLRTINNFNEFIYFIPPKDCEKSKELSGESYCNNISIVVFLISNGYRVFLPGDLQKLGMDEILNKYSDLKDKLKGGVDILITPHHGLKSSFSTTLFDNMKDKKTRSLNIVSEKINTDDNRIVDSRYSTADYCAAKNNLGKENEPHYQVKTSRGHIFIEYNSQNYPAIEIVTDKVKLIDKFI